MDSLETDKGVSGNTAVGRESGGGEGRGGRGGEGEGEGQRREVEGRLEDQKGRTGEGGNKMEE